MRRILVVSVLLFAAFACTETEVPVDTPDAQADSTPDAGDDLPVLITETGWTAPDATPYPVYGAVRDLRCQSITDNCP